MDLADGRPQKPPKDAILMASVDPAALAGAQLLGQGVEVRMSKQSVRSRIFGGEPEPTRLGRFVVVNRVGTGGMGVVYAAYDPQLDRKVALKVLRNDIVRSRRGDRKERLLAEARAMARLSHPNVVTVFEVGTVDEQVFVAMEFVDAPTLRQWSGQHRRTVAEIAAVFHQAGLGLAAAHQAGLIHRDFKPENVMVPSEGPAQVTDFGLAIGLENGSATISSPAIGAREIEKSVLTQGLAGTPAYMAPEQLASGAVDARVDQYSFCVALYEAFSGHRPFSDADVANMLASSAARGEVPELPEHAGVSKRLSAALMRGLSAAPEDRFEDMATLLRELQPRRAPRRSTIALAAVGAAGLGIGVLIANSGSVCDPPHDRLRGIWDGTARGQGKAAFARTGLAFAEDAWERAQSALDQRAAAWVESHVSTCLASQRGEQSDDRLDRRMRCLDAQLHELAAAATVLRDADPNVVENAVRVVAGISPPGACADPSTAAEIVPEVERLVSTANAEYRAAKFEAALDSADGAVTAAERHASQASLAVSMLSRARAELALAQTSEARASLDAVIDLAGRAGRFEVVAEAAIELASAAGLADADHDDGLALASAASIAVASAGSPASLRARLELLRARLLYRAGDLDEGLQRARAGLAILQGAGQSARAELADALQVQGTLLYAKGGLDSAREFTTRALEARRAVFGPLHPSVAESLGNLGAIALAEGHPQEAVTAFEQALELREQALGAAHPETAKALANLASARIANGDPRGARTALIDALERLERSVGEADPRVAAVLLNLGGVRYDLGETDAAIAAYTRALELQSLTLGKEHPQRSVALANLGRARLEIGQAPEAVVLLEEALAIRIRRLGTEHRSTNAARITLAAAHIELEQVEKARALLDATVDVDAAQGAEVELWRGRIALLESAFPSARDHFNAALEIREAAPESGSIVAAQLLLAHAFAGLGDARRSRALALAAANAMPDALPPPELREFCDSDCSDEVARLTVSASD